MKLFLATLFSIGLISIIWSCLVAASDADDRSEEYLLCSQKSLSLGSNIVSSVS